VAAKISTTHANNYIVNFYIGHIDRRTISYSAFVALIFGLKEVPSTILTTKRIAAILIMEKSTVKG
jgi:hypothetical protein